MRIPPTEELLWQKFDRFIKHGSWKLNCLKCGEEVKFQAQIAAPGYGQSWKCASETCGAAHWYRSQELVLYEEVPMEELDMPVEWVI